MHAESGQPNSAILSLYPRTLVSEFELLQEATASAAPAEVAVGSNGSGSNGHGPAVLETIEALAEGNPNGQPPDLPLVLESLLVVAEEPPTVRELARATEAPVTAVEEGLAALAAACGERGIRIQRVGKTVQLSTAPEAARYVERFLGLDRPKRLSRAALETLAIIAYRQPVAKSMIEAVRGVRCNGSLQTLRDRELVEPVGQAEGPGQAYLYGTTVRFLEHFGLQRLDELPPLGNGRHWSGQEAPALGEPTAALRPSAAAVGRA